jgi:hypothetical protein
VVADGCGFVTRLAFFALVGAYCRGIVGRRIITLLTPSPSLLMDQHGPKGSLPWGSFRGFEVPRASTPIPLVCTVLGTFRGIYARQYQASCCVVVALGRMCLTV